MIAETQALASTARHSDILAALHDASAKTGSDFNYLLSTAMRESGLDSQAKSKSSSATGLFQFLDQTWLGLVKRFGDRYGLGEYAGAIENTGSGHYAVASADTKAAILALRQDPKLSALMAGEAAQQTKQSLECALGRQICDGELYAAHFLGQGGARQLIQLHQQSPQSRADLAFPQAAKANHDAFYHADGTPKTVDELYAWATGNPGSGASVSSQIAATNPRFPLSPVLDSDVSQIAKMATGESSDLSILAQSLPSAAHVPAKTWSASTAGTNATVASIVGLPQPPLSLAPGVLEMLAAYAPAQLSFKRAA